MTDRRAAQQAFAAGELERLAGDVAATGSGNRNRTLHIASLRAGHYIAAGALGVEQASQRLLAAALRARLPASEARSAIRSGLAAGQKTPAFQVDRVGSGSASRPRAVPVSLPETLVADPAIEAGYQALIASLVELCPVTGDVERYLRSRGLPTDVADVIALPPVEHQGALVTELAARHGRAPLLASGMLDKAGLRFEWREWRLGFLWRCAITGQVSTVQRRFLGRPPGDAAKVVFPRGRGPTWPWGSHPLASMPRREPLVIVEGVLDAIAWKVLHQFEDAAPCIALPSATGLRAEWLSLFAAREVFVALDSDEAGEAASKTILEQLSGCARAIRVPPWPGEKDWAEHVERAAEVRQ
jgi:hypothetical protein